MDVSLLSLLITNNCLQIGSQRKLGTNVFLDQ